MTIEGLISLDEIGYLEWGWCVNPLMIKNRMITFVYFSARVEWWLSSRTYCSYSALYIRIHVNVWNVINVRDSYRVDRDTWIWWWIVQGSVWSIGMKLIVRSVVRKVGRRRSSGLDTIARRCCASNCGPSNGVSVYQGRLTYICSTDRCNEAGSEAILTGGTSKTAIKRKKVSRNSSNLALSSTTTSTTVPRPTSLQCYDCSGVSCGREGSPVAMNCPTCMVYRNPADQSK